MEPASRGQQGTGSDVPARVARWEARGECVEGSRHRLRCSGWSRWELVAASDRAGTVTFELPRGSTGSMFLDVMFGATLNPRPTGLARLDGRPLPPGTRHVVVPIDPGQTHTLEVAVFVRAERAACDDAPRGRCTGGSVRHWVAGRGRYRRRYAYTIPSIRHVAGPARPELTVRWPASFEHLPAQPRPGQPLGGRFVARRARGVEHGPFVAAGGVVGQGALIQAGYDFSWPHGRWSRSTGLVIDVAPSERVTLTPLFELVAPFRTGFVTPPSFTAGFGVPVDVWPRVTPGLRLQGSLYVPFVSLAAYVDFMPFTRDARVAVVARVSL